DPRTGPPGRVGVGGSHAASASPGAAAARRGVRGGAGQRTAVPARLVALAGEFSAIYPRRSPGGWQLLGHTDAVLWDLQRPNPALLTQGMWVQFRAV
ncbi:carboxyltransferase domain-containing protein, partial [Mycobacterium avium]|uniref:carboxyltransferase domain-containing protein n=1 Tax=Mycobacterium avium TaxID=1764 RepID=UPI001F27D807